MKINNQYTPYLESYQSHSNYHHISNESKTIFRKESVEMDLSQTSQQIRLTSDVEDSEQAERISEIKKAIAEGKYEVSSRNIAEKMLQPFKGVGKFDED